MGVKMSNQSKNLDGYENLEKGLSLLTKQWNT